MYKAGTKLLKDGRAFVITRCDDDEGYVRYMLHDCETGERVWRYKSTLDNVYTLAPEPKKDETGYKVGMKLLDKYYGRMYRIDSVDACGMYALRDCETYALRCWCSTGALATSYILAPEPKEEGMEYKVRMELRHNASGSMRRITGICRGLAGELYYLLDEDEGNAYSADELDKYYTVTESVEPCLVHLMSADEVERRLNDGEDPVALSIEHWVQNAAYIAAGGTLLGDSYHGLACPLCHTFGALCRGRCSIKIPCADCPLSIIGDCLHTVS